MTEAAPEDGPEGTIVLRPRLARIAGFAIGGLVLAVSVGSAILVGSFDLPNRIMFVAFGLAVFWFCWREAIVKVVAEPDRLVVRNLLGVRTLEWAEVIGVSFPAGDPWAHLDLADGDTLATMAIQRSDGERALADARLLARLVRERGEAHPPQEPPAL